MILVPTSSVIPTRDVVNDHRMYLPLVSVLTLLVLGVCAAGRSAVFYGRVRARMASVLGASLLALVGVFWGLLTVQRNQVYCSEFEIWQDTVTNAPNNPYAHNNLGNILDSRGQVDEAIAQYRKALEIKLDYEDAYLNLGNALAGRGQVDEAIAQYRRALEIMPNDVDASRNLGIVLSERERTLKTLAERREALRIRPNDAALLNDTAWMLATNPNASVRNGTEAVELAERALRLSGGNDSAVLDTLAAAYAEVGRFPETVQTAERALALATSQSNTSLARKIAARLKLYRSAAPFRDMR